VSILFSCSLRAFLVISSTRHLRYLCLVSYHTTPIIPRSYLGRQIYLAAATLATVRDPTPKSFHSDQNPYISFRAWHSFQTSALGDEDNVVCHLGQQALYGVPISPPSWSFEREIRSSSPPLSNHNSISLQPIFGDHTSGFGCFPGRNQLSYCGME
jgi:hypothetical protein